MYNGLSLRTETVDRVKSKIVLIYCLWFLLVIGCANHDVGTSDYTRLPLLPPTETVSSSESLTTASFSQAQVEQSNPREEALTPLALRLPTETPRPSSKPTESPTPFPTPIPLAKMAAESCPVTIPNGGTLPHTGDTLHGNEALVIPVGTGGKIVVPPDFVNEDGSIDWKMGITRIVPGEIEAIGQRLDAPAPLAEGYYNKEGYGSTGFQSGAIHFPSEGCWVITVQVGEAAPLTFVVLVARVAFDFKFFPQRVVRWLPEEMKLVDIDVSSLPYGIGNIYRFSNGSEGTITVEVIERNREDPAAPGGFPKAAQQPITVFGLPGNCVLGARDEQGQWQSDAGGGFLEWSNEEFSYRISQIGLDLHCHDLLRIAGS